ncbi:TetR family transcriptional regulator [Eggerthellaceae bacterium zg-887]|nr:TetR family transcriptional regulator [Xiamenia xianingshaonis]
MSQKEAPVSDHDAFEKLPAERQERVIAAGVEAFGRNGYQHARTQDIASRCGISKGLLFFYFRNKCDFYFYLLDTVREKMVESIIGEEYWQIDDYFDVMLYCADARMDVFDRYPYLIEFSIRAFYSEHRDVSTVAGRWMYNQVDELLERYFHHVHADRFRDEVSMRDATDLLIWLGDGYMHQQRSLGRAIRLDEMMVQFRGWCAMVKQWAYKPEFL